MQRLLLSDHAVILYAAGVVAILAALPPLRAARWAGAVRRAGAVLLVGVIVAVLSTTLRGSSTPTGRVNLIPGASILELTNPDNRNALENVMGNLLLFFPIGFLAIVVLGWRIRWVTAAACAMSICIEVTQLALGDRWVDIDDVLLNTVGAAVGALIGTGARSVLHQPSSQVARQRPE